MNFVGVDLHKKTISLCVMVEVGRERKVVCRKRFFCSDPAAIRKFFEQLGKFEVVVEATSCYEWFLRLVEDLAVRYVLAHPKKMRVIAESKNKSDKVDAQVLAEFLLLNMIPEAWRPSARVQEHRALVRQRRCLSGRITAAKCKLRNRLAMYNSDIASLFTKAGEAHLARVQVSLADRLVIQQLQAELKLFESQLDEIDQALQAFAQTAPTAEREARAVLDSMPQVGAVTIDAVLSELGDWRRFRSAKRVVAYAGLNPGRRESDRKVQQLSISKDGSRILRWAMVQTAWRLVGASPRWERIFENLKRNTGSKKKAIIGVARRLLCVMFAMLRDGKRYEYIAV